MADDGQNELPRGVIRQQRRGWQGEEMEMNHQRESFHAGKDKKNVAAGVDIRQFQNHEVGEGYQAKHVVRQPSSNPSQSAALKVRDMSGGSKFGQQDKEEKLSDSGNRNYIQNSGLREFRKEIELILASPS